MKWIKIKDDLPIEGSFVLARIENKKHSLLCRYKNDSFGLGDDDFKVDSWKYIIAPMQHDPTIHTHNLQSTSQAEDHINVYSSGLQQRLA